MRHLAPWFFGENRAWEAIDQAIAARPPAMNLSAIYGRRRSRECSMAFEAWHDDPTSIYYDAFCCDHAPLGPVERKGLAVRMRRMVERQPATPKRPRGY